MSGAEPEETSQPATECAFEVELQVVQGPSAGERHRLQRFPAYVGRGAESDVRLSGGGDDPLLSRRHLKVSVEGGRIVVVDVSTNGTWVEQRHLTAGEPMTLTGGEAVRLGPRTTVVLRLLGMAPEEGDAEKVATDTRSVRMGAGPHVLDVRLLGTVCVQTDDTEINVWSSRKAVVLLACLAEEPAGRTIAVERLVDQLWPDHLADARAALQATVSRLRKAFRTAGGSLPDPVELHRGGYRLHPAWEVHCDALRFDQACQQAASLQAAGQRDEAAARLEEAIALYQGPFLDGFSDDWAQARRRTLECRYFDAVDALAELREAQGRLGEAVRLYAGALERDPCREHSQLGLMRSLAASGRRDEALRGYYDFARRLKKEMGLGPSPDLVRLHETLQGGADAASAPGG